ncbi:MAG: potassium channel family protein [Chromatiales bacterium]|nr:potassium channel family protein [Chromatiales bacterium]
MELNKIKSLPSSIVVFLLSLITIILSQPDDSWLHVSVVVFWLIANNANFGIAFSSFSLKQTVLVREVYILQFIELCFTAITNIFLFAYLYRVFGINTSCGDITHGLLDSIYFSIVTWTTLGYGDFSPTEVLRIPAAIEALLGYTYMAILIGLLLTIFNRKPDAA